ALDPGVFGDQAADRVAAEQGDRQFARRGVEGRNRARVLLAVHHPVVVAVAIARVVPGEELAAVAKLVAVLVAAGLVDRQREVVALLPAVGDSVVIAVAMLCRR